MPRSRSNSLSDPVPYLESAAQVASLAGRLAEEKVIAFDTEFLWEKSYSPRLALIQVAAGETAWIVDPLALSQSELQPLLDVLAAPDTLKVAHAVDQDQLCLHHSYGFVAEPVLDTAVAAALTGMGDQIGLSKMLAKLVDVHIDKGYTRTNWMKRPLSPEMLRYAADDVLHLPKAADLLLADLHERGRADWAMDLSAKIARTAKAHFEPRAMARKLAERQRLDAPTFAVLQALIAWRETEARRKDIPRRWLAEDKILVKLAMARPTSAKRLADFRGVGGIQHPSGAQKILKAIQSGLRTPVNGYTRPESKRGPNSREAAALVVLKCFLNAVAAEQEIPLRLLIENDNLVGLLRGRFKTVQALRESELLESRAVDLVGAELIAILNGQRSLRIVDGVATHEGSATASADQGSAETRVRQSTRLSWSRLWDQIKSARPNFAS